jgi:hypothetical protein
MDTDTLLPFQGLVCSGLFIYLVSCWLDSVQPLMFLFGANIFGHVHNLSDPQECGFSWGLFD